MMLLNIKRRRVLLVCVLLLAICLVFAGRTSHRAAIQREAVSKVRKTGGSVVYTYDISVPQWCVDLVGIDFFATVTSVSYFEWGVPMPENKRNFLALADLNHLRELDVFESTFPSDILADMTSITRLSVVRHTLTDVDATNIAQLKQLQVLVLCENNLSDAGAFSLAGLPNLTELDVSGNFVTDEAVDRLRTLLPNCEVQNRWRRGDGLSFPASRAK